MKRRLRKKLHKGEYREIGISLKISVTDKATDVLDKLYDIADANKLIFCGGTAGYVITPGQEYGNFKIPKKIGYLMSVLISNPYSFSDDIIGYYFDPITKTISADKIENIKVAIHALNVEYKANYSVDLWN